VVARRRSHLCVALPSGVYDIAGITVLALFARVKDPLPDRRSALVCWPSCCAARVDGCLLVPHVAVILRTRLMAYAGRQALVLRTTACSMKACALRRRLRALGVEGSGMARSSVTVVMSFWLTRGGVCMSSMLKSALMRLWAYLPSFCARSPRAEASPALVARRSRTCP
jgi:hypothetical protein